MVCLKYQQILVVSKAGMKRMKTKPKTKFKGERDAIGLFILVDPQKITSRTAGALSPSGTRFTRVVARQL